ncbi:Cisplatin resistance-associated overexpressed protein [Caligus rogercresseyi]|uniref:Cisplatin resistance-associated overexpressed protein n=1 Tax=Caligus rogercresseyi TaxID=217165 RepID=A0A7T8KM33_CALRO|nr:Cisplatin resistance-associated overexpressed protein [Caligus rogercresseyi]
MATSQIASMLDELMGRNRNVGPKESVREIHWSDSEVCRYYLADLGPCSKLHDEELKAQFLSASPEHYKKAQYVDDFLRFCARMLHELASRIKKAKERLSLTQREQQEQGEPEEELFLGGEAKERRHQSKSSPHVSTDSFEEAEAKGAPQAHGQSPARAGCLRHAALPSEPSSLSNSIMLQQKAMEVCDVCGAFLIVGDAQQRIDDHLLGNSTWDMHDLELPRIKSRRGQTENAGGTGKGTEETTRGRAEKRRNPHLDPHGKKRDRRSRSRKRSKSRKRSRSREKQSRSREGGVEAEIVDRDMFEKETFPGTNAALHEEKTKTPWTFPLVIII